MPSWSELQWEYESQADDDAKLQWLSASIGRSLSELSRLRSGRNVILYATAFLQKPAAPPFATMIMMEDINGLMSVIHGMDCSRALTLVLHTPGGDPSAANTLVEYLHSKFTDIEVIVPTFAMSAGTMICLGADRLVMGRQSQLGPIDAQMQTKGGSVSAGAVMDTFARARNEILDNQSLAHLWHPVLQAMGPSLIQEAQNALAFGEEMVRGWLEQRMFRGNPDAPQLAAHAARHFNATEVHKNHSRRIDSSEARSLGIPVEELEADQDLQEAVLTAYHVISLNFTVSRSAKVMANNLGAVWQKHL